MSLLELKNVSKIYAAQCTGKAGCVRQLVNALCQFFSGHPLIEKGSSFGKPNEDPVHNKRIKLTSDWHML